MTRLSTLLATEGTYPFHRGDVSTWCHRLVQGLDDVDFTLVAVTSHPYLGLRWDLPPNVASIVTAPVSAFENAAEFGNHASAAEYLGRRLATSTAAIEEEFLPHLDRFVQQVTHPLVQPRALAVTLLEMHLHLRYYDYDRTLTHPATWDAFTRAVRQAWHDAYPAAAEPGAAELLSAGRLLYRLLLPLAIEVPRTDLVHATAPGFCGLPCIVAKLRWRTPFLLSEHGVYLREHYLLATSAVSSTFLRWFATRVTGAITDVNYACADRIAPVCAATAQWERWRGADGDRIGVIPNGVPALNTPVPLSRPGRRPVVVSVGNLTPLGGQLLLIEAAATVRRATPGVEFRLYGEVDDPATHQRCRDLVTALSLDDTVSMFGADDAAAALQDADVVAVPGAPDGVPYALLDGMMAARPIVAVNEGGIAEVLGEAGAVVAPGNPGAFAAAVTSLLQSPDHARQLAADASDRARAHFTSDRLVAAYRAAYEGLGRARDEKVTRFPDSAARRRVAAIA